MSPWHWYFLTAVPKSVTCAVFFIFVGLIYQKRKSFLGVFDQQAFDILGPVVIFIGIFSVLPHKELRFIMPSITLLNVVGAYGLSKMYDNLLTA